MTQELRELRKSLEFCGLYGKRLRKHAKFIAAVFLWGIFVSILTLNFLPPRYRSSTLVLVQQPRIPSSYVNSPVSVDLEKRLNSVAAQITSRPHLEQILLTLYPALRDDPGGLEEPVAWMRKAIQVQVKGLDTFRISYDHTSPELAQKTTQELARLFIEDNLNDRTQQALATSKMIDDELRTLKAKFPFQGGTSKSPRRQVSSEEQLAHLESSLSEKLTQYTNLHPDVRALRMQIRDMKAALYGPTGHGTKARATVSQNSTTTKAHYEELLNKKFQADLSVTFEKAQKETAYKILEPAYVPTIPVWPRGNLIIIGGSLLALFMGLGIALFWELSDLTIRSVAELRTASNLPILMTIPSIPSLTNKGSIEIVPKVLNAGSIFHRAPSPMVVIESEPASIAAEQFRLLAHLIEQKEVLKTGGTLAISSSLQGEGKSMISLNLAFALAESTHRRICLCDIDLRAGTLARRLGFGVPDGIVNVLRGERQVADVLLPINANLALLPSGPAANATLGLLRSRAFRVLVASLRSHFDYVLFDCPPLCLSDDVEVIDDVVDRSLFVVRASIAGVDAVQDGLAKVSPAKILGLVLNDMPILAMKYRPYGYHPECEVG